MFKVPEKYRIKYKKESKYFTNSADGNNGCFNLKNSKGVKFFVIASDGSSWEHVSVTLKDKQRCPSWDEMCFIKKQFWDDEDMVVQYHPPKSEYVSFHNFCLHLWRPINQTILAPDHLLVAPKGIKPI